jgi:hypothetical protein
MSDELVKRLREDQPVTQDMVSTMQCALQDAAAGRIERLEAELITAEQRGYANAMEAERKLHEERIEELEAKAMKASNAALLEKRRADEAEGKLAKAVGALEFYRSAINLRIDCEITYAMQEAHDNAETFLAELKGEDRG